MKAEPVRLACFNPSFVVDLKKESKPPPKKKKKKKLFYTLVIIYSNIYIFCKTVLWKYNFNYNYETIKLCL